MYINGIEDTIAGIREMGNAEYCAPEEAAGGLFLSSAIGACGSKETELVNAYSTMASMGVYKPISSILEVKNSQGDTLKKWKDESKQVIDPQVAYIVNDILADQRASAALHGVGATNIPGVRTSTKTGTSDRDSKPKDLWIATYSPVLAMGLWLGNSDTSTIGSVNSAFGMPIVRNVMSYAHQDIYAKENRWSADMWFTRPDGIQQVGSDLYPSWWNKSQGKTNAKLTFDRVSKKKATECTPPGAREELDVLRSIDPITKSEVFSAPDGYDATKDDDAHSCDDRPPSIDSINLPNGNGTRTLKVTVSRGTFALATIDILVDGVSVKSAELSAGGGTVEVSVSGSVDSVTVNVRDQGYYTDSKSKEF